MRSVSGGGGIWLCCRLRACVQRLPRPRRTLPGSREAGFDIFIWSTNDSLKAPGAPGAFHWPSLSVPHLSSAYINRFSAPFTSSGAAVVKSALCHVPFKYLMLLEEMRSATVRPQPGAFLGCARMETFPNFKCTHSARITAAFGKSVKFHWKMKFV